MKKLVLSGFVAMLAVSASLALEPITAGPQKGDKVPGPFHPLNINGEAAGKKSCLFCRFGEDPVAMVFVRSATPEVTALVKKLDETKDLNACAIFCSDEAGLQAKLEECVKKNEIKNVVLAIDNPAGPEGYKIA